MGYDVSIYKKVKDIEEYDMRKALGDDIKIGQFGSNLCLGDKSTFDACITYNYSDQFYKYMHKKNGLRFLNGKNVVEAAKIINKTIGRMLQDTNTWNYFDPQHNIDIKKSKYWYKNKNHQDNNSLTYTERDLWHKHNYWTDTLNNAYCSLNNIMSWIQVILLEAEDPENYFIKVD